MNVQNIKIRSEEEENVGAFGNWLKVKAIAVIDNVREHFKQVHVQQAQAKNNRNRSIKAHQQGILRSKTQFDVYNLDLFHLMD
jgi:hypothetical protein